MKIFSTLILFLLSGIPAIAGPGDTVFVQTFNFSWPKRAGNGEREGRFLFPERTKQFQKILMQYKLKCDPSQSPACGEWDYIAYTYLYQHTGRLDSTLYTHSDFQADNKDRDTLLYMNSTSWIYRPFFERRIVHDDTTSLSDATIGNGTDALAFPLSAAKDGRAQFLWTAPELSSAGMKAGLLTGIRLKISTAGGMIKDLRVRAGLTASDRLSPDSPLLDSLTTVYRRTTSFPAAGEVSLQFLTPISWDGKSGIVIDLSYEEIDGGSVVIGADTSSAALMIASAGEDAALDFAPVDFVPVSPGAFSTIDSAVTVAFWQYGDPDKQPLNSSIFNAVDAKGQRVLNAHLPWGNGSVYWDAGQSSGYDRINKAATAADYKGGWNHWAFTKNSKTGVMNMYLNGKLWHSGTGMTKRMNGIVKFAIGAVADGTSSQYDGMIDDFAVWNVALDEGTISDWMHRTPGLNHPAFGNLVALFPFDENGGVQTANSITSEQAPLIGRPLWTSYKGERVKNFSPLAKRPVMTFEQGVFASRMDSTLVVDSARQHQIMIVMYGDSLKPTIPTDTLYRWPAWYRYSFDASGTVLDSTLVPPDGMMIRKLHHYYGAPFEVVNRFELGRFITPYGNNLSLGEGWTWTYDVTDFRPLLADSVHLVAGNWQELLDLRFVMIEGAPERDVVRIENLWRGDFALKDQVTKMPPDTLQLDPAASSFKLRATLTGHQFSNPTNCAEFCPKIHSLDIDGITRYSWQIVQECAMNPLHPQGGTWIFDRAGWCPGMPATTRELELTPYLKGNSVILDYNWEPDDYGNYVVETQLVSYTALRRSLDAAVEEIIAPNKHEMYVRFNPCCGRPRIRLMNRGTAALTSADISYGPEGGNSSTHHWTGNLASLASMEVDLPAFDWGGWSPANMFRVSITAANGSTDENATNNTMTVPFDPAPVYDKYLLLNFNTAYAAAENSYEIQDASGNILLSKSNFKNSTMYRDTLIFPPGCYELLVYDAADDGVDFWYFPDKGKGIVRLTMLGGGLYKTLNPDFGHQLRHAFSYSRLVDAGSAAPPEKFFDVYPNPASGHFTLSFALDAEETLAFTVHDLLGRKRIDSGPHPYGPGRHQARIDVSGLNPGTYLIAATGKNGVVHRQFLRLL
jgi:hypothetical protein